MRARGQAAVGLPVHANGHRPRGGLHRTLRSVGGPVEDHDDAEVAAQYGVGHQLLVEGVQEAEEGSFALVGRDGDRHRREGHEARY